MGKINYTMAASNPNQKPGGGFRRILRSFLIIAIMLLIAFFAFAYWGVYDEGFRAGTVVRVSKKGVVFKTYEGQLNLQSFGALKGASPFAETFDFSVEKGEEDLIRELQAAALSGERVNLHYFKRYVKLPWRGKTLYFVSRVEHESDPQEPEKKDKGIRNR